MIAGKGGSDAVALRNSSTQKNGGHPIPKISFLPTASPEKRGFGDHQAIGTGIEGGLHTERKRGVVGAVTEWELVDHRHTQGCQTLLQHLFERLRVRPG